jgi:hypothetical protein
MIQTLIEDKMERETYAFTQAGDKVTIKWLTDRMDLHPDLEKISIIVIFPFDRNFEW